MGRRNFRKSVDGCIPFQGGKEQSGLGGGFGVQDGIAYISDRGLGKRNSKLKLKNSSSPRTTSEVSQNPNSGR